MNTGLILRERRLQLGLTTEYVAQLAGIDKNRHHRYEDGRMDIMKAGFEVACKIIRILGMDVEDFSLGKYCEQGSVSIVDGKLSYGVTGGVQLILQSKNYDVLAKGEYTFLNHMKVLAGSRISPDSNLRELGWEKRQCLREELIQKGIIVDRIFVQDYEFRSPSGACSIICGRHLTGSNVWKTEDGKTLGELLKASRATESLK